MTSSLLRFPSEVNQQNNTIILPVEILVALLRAVGGSITLDMYDLQEYNNEKTKLVFFHQADPARLLLKVEEVNNVNPQPG
jgi:hypothetical protein